MPPSPLRFYFDYVSPNAYLAWTQLPALADRHRIAVPFSPLLAPPVSMIAAGDERLWGHADGPQLARFLDGACDD